MFFDYTVDKTIKSYSIDMLFFENDEWTSKAQIIGSITNPSNQIAIQYMENEYNVFTISESGHEKYYASEKYLGFNNTMLQASKQVTNAETIVASKEIPLFYKIGTTENELLPSTNFRESNCSAGIAFTITFSTKEVK